MHLIEFRLEDGSSVVVESKVDRRRLDFICEGKNKRPKKLTRYQFI